MGICDLRWSIRFKGHRSPSQPPYRIDTAEPDALEFCETLLVRLRSLEPTASLRSWLRASCPWRICRETTSDPERFLGSTVMSETARFMLVDPPGREQRFYSDFTPNMKHGDDAILKTQRWLATHREQPASVAYLARQSGLEPRTFLRRFIQATGIKPSEYQKRLQISRAREILSSLAPASTRSRRG
jgi:hypothetical protein